ncbi:hypothetical protein VMCG_05878 [Cytospora schulzeri]|uniref:D-isomer specific 2-hydroxyacid dehydrogenase NAD-binding domain-containing protein n=1 Tax=Cytospora schulzeri TaxID=448051 RepID=A0A423WD39_9PEZI|nr:hypothetical protein VMCG_05878 [Valsa malicola]
MTVNGTKPIVLHLGDPIKYNTEIYAELESRFTVIRPSLEERQRDAFLDALRKRKWGDFSAIARPWWGTGGEMGRWDQELVPLLPKSLVVFASAGAGYDWADVDVLAEYGILYCNGASASSEAVADMAIYHIISVFRNMQWTNMAARAGDPVVFNDAHHNAQFTAHNPAGRTLGVIGLGNIGYKIAHKAHAAFGMNILYYDVSPKPADQEAAIGAHRCATLGEMLAQADCTVLAAPGQAGRKVIDREQIAQLKRGSRLVNVARGSLVNEEAVADALESGHLHAVGLDVFENEPHPSPRLVKNRQATLTCHTAGGALETTIGFERLAIENVLRVLTGQQPLTPVNKQMIKQRSMKL